MAYTLRAAPSRTRSRAATRNRTIVRMMCVSMNLVTRLLIRELQLVFGIDEETAERYYLFSVGETVQNLSVELTLNPSFDFAGYVAAVFSLNVNDAMVSLFNDGFTRNA